MNVCPHKAWQDVPLNGRKCVDCGMWLEDYPETRPQATAIADAEQVWREALTAFANAGNQAATAVIQAYGDARADAARQDALEEAAKVADGYAAAGKDNPQLAPISAQMRYCAQRIRALKENPNAG